MHWPGSGWGTARGFDACRSSVVNVAAVVSVWYGFAKINGSQFAVLDLELDRPMG
ncbi:hypothetical protein LX15_005900 [Streptoalloteichus tenebrarius]|uniref:Uncharacterized protein n=1 Tax=Streptoalloteichus tenebrarius (strain ATCC 17920 / DSM 40477 / JCM 4838 / CBS 697.72 / NBRC 16177 / NCIMB 11028 / NRRL B-12390 / A12253. 1 / ISP 5477) TaxID=1933 RepID=A0ABT1I377_STRSD|nr:hypothetical protein [Streptoalloteichus tenebrarius]BFF00031.1 hypothetical protein GCM10020241_17060 [Streptoalloteichus tenebrarius]